MFFVNSIYFLALFLFFFFFCFFFSCITSISLCVLEVVDHILNLISVPYNARCVIVDLGWLQFIIVIDYFGNDIIFLWLLCDYFVTGYCSLHCSAAITLPNICWPCWWAFFFLNSNMDAQWLNYATLTLWLVCILPISTFLKIKTFLSWSKRSVRLRSSLAQLLHILRICCNKGCQGFFSMLKNVPRESQLDCWNLKLDI